MSIQPPTKALLAYIQSHPEIRYAIRAPPDQTVVYCGCTIEPSWKEFERMRLTLPQLAGRRLLPEILRDVATPGQPFPNLFEWVDSLTPLLPERLNSHLAWRVLSGIMCANAMGKVSFLIGGSVTPTKVFAATEVWALSANTKLHQDTRELLEYYKSCILSGQTSIHFGFIAG